MTDEDMNMITLLKQILVKEEILGTFLLATIQLDFYQKLKYYIETYNGTSEEKENYQSMLETLLRKRCYKIIQMATYHSLTPEIMAKLSEEEREYYVNIYNSTILFKNKLF